MPMKTLPERVYCRVINLAVFSLPGGGEAGYWGGFRFDCPPGSEINVFLTTFWVVGRDNK